MAVEKVRSSYGSRADEYAEHLGFFEGPRIEPFDHAVVTAYFWPIDAMEQELTRAGFEIVDTHARTDQGSRPHGAILARRAGHR